MAFREPMGFAPTALRRRASTSKSKAKKTGKPRRRVAVVGGVSRTSPTTKKPQEKRSMAKSKKRRTPAQKAATARMLAANKAKRRSNPTKKTAKKRRRTKAKVRTLKSGGKSLRVKSGTKLATLAKPARTFRKKVQGRTKSGVTRTYRTYKNKKAGVIVRENPANRGKAIMSAAAGFGVGIIAADVLDRYVAARKIDGTQEVLYGAAAKKVINGKSDSMRIFAQAAGTGVTAVGAYMLRKKSVVGTYLLGGMAAAFAAKAVGLVVKDHIMPALLKTDEAEGLGKRLGYVDGPRRAMMGAPRPFQGKPTHIGPQATGSVGAYGCTRVPVNPSSYMKPGEDRNSCKPWPFEVDVPRERIDAVNKRPPLNRIRERNGSDREPGLSEMIQNRVPRTPRTPDMPSGEVPGTEIPGTQIPNMKLAPKAPFFRGYSVVPTTPRFSVPTTPDGPSSGRIPPSRFSPTTMTEKFVQSRTPAASKIVIAPRIK